MRIDIDSKKLGKSIEFLLPEGGSLYQNLRKKPVYTSLQLAFILSVVMILCHGTSNWWGLPWWGEMLLFLITSSFFITPFLRILSESLEFQRKHIKQFMELSSFRSQSMEQAAAVALNKISATRENDKSLHLKRVGQLAILLCESLNEDEKYKGYISENYIKDLQVACTLHDIGNMGVPEQILQKEGTLSSSEFEAVKMHTIIGGDMIAELQASLPQQTYFTLAREVAYHHHQRWDGKGYPNVVDVGGREVYFVQDGVGKALEGNQIPLSARIVSLIDVYETLLSERYYKKAFTHRMAVTYIQEERGSHFDPDVVDAFLRVQDEFYKVILQSQQNA